MAEDKINIMSGEGFTGLGSFPSLMETKPKPIGSAIAEEVKPITAGEPIKLELKPEELKSLSDLATRLRDKYLHIRDELSKAKARHALREVGIDVIESEKPRPAERPVVSAMREAGIPVY